MDEVLDRVTLERLAKTFAADDRVRLLQNAVVKNGAEAVALDNDVVTSSGHTFSHHLTDRKVTAQGKSGRCWLFAGLNLLRRPMMETFSLASFELSQAYLMFWDKLERANYFLEAMLATASRPLDDRTVAFLLESVGNDGGQWNMFVALVATHGIVPKQAMPETQSSADSAGMNGILRRVLREGAARIRAAAANGPGEAREEKAEILETVHRVLSLHLGTPPERVDWQWEDDDHHFHRVGWLTPEEFAERYVSLPLEDYVCLVHDPRPSSPPGRTFTVDYLGNVVGAPPVTYLNVDIELTKRLAAETIAGGEAVWFGCDVGKMQDREAGIMASDLYDYESVVGMPLDMTKAERLDYGESLMTHAMVFTGINIVDGRPNRWRVENSWGTDNGQKGYFVMDDDWFDAYMYQVVVRRSYLPEELQAALSQEPIELQPWDPMGSLAL